MGIIHGYYGTRSGLHVVLIHGWRKIHGSWSWLGMEINHGPPKICQKVWILIMGTMVLNPIWFLIMAPVRNRFDIEGGRVFELYLDRQV